MSVRFARRIVGRILMPMMLVVDMRVSMLHWLVHVFMFVVLDKVEPHARGHQQTCCEQLNSQRLEQKH